MDSGEISSLIIIIGYCWQSCHTNIFELVCSLYSNNIFPLLIWYVCLELNRLNIEKEMNGQCYLLFIWVFLTWIISFSLIEICCSSIFGEFIITTKILGYFWRRFWLISIAQNDSWFISLPLIDIRKHICSGGDSLVTPINFFFLLRLLTHTSWRGEFILFFIHNLLQIGLLNKKCLN